MRNSTKGYYTLEAALFLPLILLTVLSLGYFTRVEGVWENCVHCAADESCRAQAMAWDGISGRTAAVRIIRRVRAEQDAPDSFTLRQYRYDSSRGDLDHLTSYEIAARVQMTLPAGFSRDFSFSCPVLYRNFVGRTMSGNPLGTAGLENSVPQNPAHIFPAYGEKYHRGDCTYVKATVRAVNLNGSVTRTHPACRLCHSGDIPAGSVVFCFDSPDTAYHRGSCSSIQRHVTVIDRSEAEEKGYTPCDRCGGGLPRTIERSSP